MDWFDALKACRRVGGKGTFTASELASEVHSTPFVASGLLGKFVKWGYVRREGRQIYGRGRPITIYSLTDYGKRRGPATSKLPRHPMLVKKDRQIAAAKRK